jgi:hypothetical protein
MTMLVLLDGDGDDGRSGARSWRRWSRCAI